MSSKGRGQGRDGENSKSSIDQDPGPVVELAGLSSWGVRWCDGSRSGVLWCKVEK